MGSEAYRYGFNGKENDNSTGEGNLDFGARVMDVRLGKFLSIDPLYDKYPMISPYNFAISNPVLYTDVDGKEYVLWYTNNSNKEVSIRLKNWKDIEKLKSIDSKEDFVKNMYKLLLYAKGEFATEEVLKHKKSINIKYKKGDVGEYRRQIKTIYFDPLIGLEHVSDEQAKLQNQNEISNIDLVGIGKFTTPGALFVHEEGHAYNDLFFPEMAKTNREIPDELYQNSNEAQVTKEFENKFKLLHPDKEDTRTNHSGIGRYFLEPDSQELNPNKTSSDERKIEINKVYRKNLKRDNK